jgi:hypothetical protein
MIAGDYYNAGDATLVKDRRRAKFTTSIERNRIPNYQKARGIIAELIPNAGINFTSSLRFIAIMVIILVVATMFILM